MVYFWAYLFAYIVTGMLFGYITKSIANSKGYEGGFWWGFFLNIIGILVVGFRADKRQLQNGNNGQQGKNYSSTSPMQQNPMQSRGLSKYAESTWTCISCNSENPEKAKFCYKCGEARHYKWKCSRCGEVNAEVVRFCGQCGKEKEEKEEVDSSAIVVGSDLVPLDELNNLKQRLDDETLQIVIEYINTQDYNWRSIDELGEIGLVMQELGVVDNKKSYGRDGMSDREAEKEGYGSWIVYDDGSKKFFKRIKMAPDMTLETLKHIVDDVYNMQEK